MRVGGLPALLRQCVNQPERPQFWQVVQQWQTLHVLRSLALNECFVEKIVALAAVTDDTSFLPRAIVPALRACQGGRRRNVVLESVLFELLATLAAHSDDGYQVATGSVTAARPAQRAHPVRFFCPVV